MYECLPQIFRRCLSAVMAGRDFISQTEFGRPAGVSRGNVGHAIVRIFGRITTGSHDVGQ
jgi:hypothetical protein